MEIARKIETISALSKGIQSAARKSPADAKRIANMIYAIGEGKKLPSRISPRCLVDFAKAADAKRSTTELREILYPEQQAERIAKAQAERQSMARVQSAKPPNDNQEAEPQSQTNQLSAPERYAPAQARHHAHNNTVWAELSRVQEDQARCEAATEKTKKREAQAALRKQLEKQKREKENRKMHEKLQEVARAQRVVQDVQNYEKEQQEERENEKRRHMSLGQDLKGQRDERRGVLERERRAKAQEEKRVVESIERKKKEDATSDELNRQQQLAQFRKQNAENERLQQWKKDQKRQQRVEAAALGKKYCDEVEAKEKKREQELRDKAAQVQKKMQRYTQGQKDVDMRALENERRAAVEMEKRERAVVADEQNRVEKLRKAATDQRRALAQQTQMRRAMREQRMVQDKKQAADFLSSERRQMQQRVDSEARRRQQSKLQQSKWLAEQLREKKERQSNPLKQADISRTELAMNKRLLATVAATARSEVVRERVGQYVQEVALSSREE